MTATINDLVDDPFADLPRPLTCPAGEFAAPVLTVKVNCRTAAGRRWFQGQWRCIDCGGAIRFGGGIGWMHSR